MLTQVSETRLSSPKVHMSQRDHRCCNLITIVVLSSCHVFSLLTILLPHLFASSLSLSCLPFILMCSVHSGDHAIRLLLVRGRRGKVIRMTALRTRYQAFYTRFKNVHNDWNYECTTNRVNVFEIGITLPGRYEASLAAATLCRLQLCAV
jgi:hypothetical protein